MGLTSRLISIMRDPNYVTAPPEWSMLRSLGNSRMAKATVFWVFFTPVIVNLLSKVGPEITLHLADEPTTLVVELPFSWLLLYFSGISFALALLVFWFRCPGIVKEFGGFGEFQKRGMGKDAVIRFVRVAFEGCESEFRKSTLLFYNYYFKQGKRISFIDSKSVISDRLKRMSVGNFSEENMFWTVYHSHDRAFYFSRVLIWFFLFFGYFFLLIVFAQGFSSVIIFAWKAGLVF